ncbi:MAG: hypothetical protein ACP5O3_04615, partial [Candidatus Micrarchaeia archaeon]
IVFVVNINKAETARVQEISADAYHNRIVSVLELYRVDLSSLFRESMSRLIESALANPGWSLFDVPFSTGGHPELPEPQRTQQNRFESCTQVSEVIDAIICAKTEANTVCNATEEKECVSASPCKWDNSSGCVVDWSKTQSYGLQKWLSNLQREGVFEGISFGPANERNFEDFINPNANGTIDASKYTRNCRKLVPGSLFDCVNFAKNNSAPLRCCAKYNRLKDGQVVEQVERWSSSWPTASSNFSEFDCAEVVPGCEDGVFFVQIRVEDPLVFPHLPRLQASDQGGNQIRSGAISDHDFKLPIKYPIYKYMDASFRLYDRMAYGKRGTAYPAGADEVSWGEVNSDSYGIVSGLCAGPNCAAAVVPIASSTFTQSTLANTADAATAIFEGSNSLLGQGLSEVLNRYPELVFNFTDVSPPVTCGKQNNVVTCSDLTPLKTMINWNNVGCKDPNQVPCYYLLDALTVRSL